MCKGRRKPLSCLCRRRRHMLTRHVAREYRQGGQGSPLLLLLLLILFMILRMNLMKNLSQQEDDVAQVFFSFLSLSSYSCLCYSRCACSSCSSCSYRSFLAFEGESKLKAYVRNFIFQSLDPKTAVDLATTCSATLRQPLTIRELLATFIPLSIINYFLGFWTFFLFNPATFNIKLALLEHLLIGP